MADKCPIEVSPYDQSKLIKNPNLVNLNYTNQDFASLKTRLNDLIKERFSDIFNDFIESSLAIMLIENWAFIADTLSFKIDQIANEIFIDSVSEVDNAFRLAMLVGFKPLPPVASRSLWSASISNVLDTDLTIDAPVTVDISTEAGPKTIELFPADSLNNPIFNQNIIISAGSFLNTSLVGLEGKTTIDSFTGSGDINQSFGLSTSPVIWDSIRVNVDGVPWTRVDYFTDSQPRTEFRVEYDPNYRAFILFGNNRAGMIPSLGSRIEITYRVGGGVAGNIVTGSVELQRNYIVPGFNFRVPVTFRNYTRGEFGYDGDSIDDIKRKLPAFLRIQDRCVTGDDYQNFANQFATPYSGQIGKATAVLRNYGCAANIIDVYILARNDNQGLQNASNELKVELLEAFDAKKMMTDSVCIKDGVILEVDVTIDVTLDKFYKKFEDEFRDRILRKTTDFFSLNGWDYGQTLKSIDLIKDFADIKEIRTASVFFNMEDSGNSGDVVTTKFYEIVRPQTIDLSFVYE
jgi:hypothetical protein